MAKGIICDQQIPATELFSFDEPLADGIDVLGIAALDAESIAMASGGADFIGVGARIDEENSALLADIAYRQTGGAAEGSEDGMDPILVNQFSSLLYRHARVDIVLGDHLQGAAQDPSLFVDLLHRQLDAQVAVGPHHSQESGEGDNMTHPHRLGP